jgi:hypothetical protein
MTKKEIDLIEYRMRMAELDRHQQSERCWRIIKEDAGMLLEEVRRLREVLYGEYNEEISHI